MARTHVAPGLSDGRASMACCSSPAFAVGVFNPVFSAFLPRRFIFH